MSKIPEGATHQTLNGGYRKFVNGLWFGYCDGYWVRVRGDSICEFKPLTNIQAEPEFPVNCLPPIGSIVRVMDMGRNIWSDALRFIGSDCTLQAVFMTGDTQMAAVEHVRDEVCACFRADMIRTIEQVEEENRLSTVDRMREIVTNKNLKGHGLTIHLGALYDAGLRFVEVTK